MGLIELGASDLREFCQPVSAAEFRADMNGDYLFQIIEDRVPYFAPHINLNDPEDLHFPGPYPRTEINGAYHVLEGAYHLLNDNRKDTFVAHLKDAMVVPQSYCVINSQNQIVFPNSYPFDVRKENVHRYAECCTSMVMKRTFYTRQRVEYQSFLNDTMPVIETGETCILVSSQSSGNIYHWLVESVTRLWILEKWPELRKAKFIVHGANDDKVLRIMQKFGVPQSNLITLHEGAVYKFKHLIFPSAVGDVALSQPKFDFLRRLFGLPPQSEAKRPAGRKRYYITRKDTEMGRRALNEAEILAAIAPYGVEEFVMSAHPLDDLARLFSDTELLMGPMGSGLINMIFMPPRCAVIEMASRSWGGLFWSMACGTGQEYYVLGSESDVYFSNREKGYTLGLPDQMTFDPKKVAQTVEQALSRIVAG